MLHLSAVVMPKYLSPSPKTLLVCPDVKDRAAPVLTGKVFCVYKYLNVVRLLVILQPSIRRVSRRTDSRHTDTQLTSQSRCCKMGRVHTGRRRLLFLRQSDVALDTLFLQFNLGVLSSAIFGFWGNILLGLDMSTVGHRTVCKLLYLSEEVFKRWL